MLEVPRAPARAAAGEPGDELGLRQGAQRLVGELAPVAMRGEPCSPGEDVMAVSCQLSHPGPDLLERVPDAVCNGARAWLISTDLP